MLMDDKSYPFIKVGQPEKHIRIMMPRADEEGTSHRILALNTSVTAVKDTDRTDPEAFTSLRSCNRILPAISGKKDAVSIIISGSAMHRVRGYTSGKNTESRLMK